MLNGSRRLPALVSAAAVLPAGAFLTGAQPDGPLSQHMLMHIVLMNVAAPLISSLLPASRSARPAMLWTAGAVQLALLWLWHLPSLHAHGMTLPVATLMHASLLAAAVWFWRSVVGLDGHARWHTLPALLLTGKLACLLAALLIFAPRTLYTGHHAAASLEDQQLAGLLMVVACPLSYIVAAIVVTTQLIGSLHEAVPAAQRG